MENTDQDRKNCPDDWFRKEEQPQIVAGVLEATERCCTMGCTMKTHQHGSDKEGGKNTAT